MADTAVAITAGTGTNIDTRTEGTNGNHRQVVVLGDPATNAGVAAVDATNGLSVNVTNASLTVASHAVTNAGTFATQAAQSGTWTVQPGNTANTTAWKVDGSAVTQPVSLATFATEDAAASADPVGPVLIAVRRDTLSTSEVSADGDNIALKASNKGKLHVAAELRLGDTVADTGSGTGGSATQRVIIDSSQFSALGQTTMSASAPVTIASDQTAVSVTIKDVSNGEYETVAASQTDQILGATGAVGDWLEGLLIVPGTAAAGAVSIKDGNGSSISVFAGGGTTALPTLAPIYVPLGLKCVNATTAGWKVTTGTNVTAIGMGNFT